MQKTNDELIFSLGDAIRALRAAESKVSSLRHVDKDWIRINLSEEENPLYAYFSRWACADGNHDRSYTFEDFCEDAGIPVCEKCLVLLAAIEERKKARRGVATARSALTKRALGMREEKS